MRDDDGPNLYVPAKIDDAGLDPFEFRIFARIVRRCNGQPQEFRCYESIPKMARSLGIGVHTLRRSLKTLIDKGAVLRWERSGASDLFAFRSLDEWVE